jgi:hypothetical protein
VRNLPCTGAGADVCAPLPADSSSGRRTACREDARFLYKRLPAGAKQSDPAVKAGFLLLQHLWHRQYEAVWAALAYAWPEQLQGVAAALRTRLQQRAFELVERAYADLTPTRLSALMGVTQEEAVQGELLPSLAGAWCVHGTQWLRWADTLCVCVRVCVAAAALQRGWTVDAASSSILVKPAPAEAAAPASSEDLRRLAEYVVFLEA